MQIPRTHPLTLGDRVNFFPLTKPNPTDCLGPVKVPQHVMLRSVIKSSIIKIMVVVVMMMMIIIIICKISPKIIDFLIEIIPHWEVTLKQAQ